MSTLANLDPTVRYDTVANYLELALTQVHASQRPDGHFVDVALMAADDPIYGPVIGSNAEYFARHPNPAIALAAFRGLCGLTIRSSQQYAADVANFRPDGTYNSDDFRDELLGMQTAMATDGSFKLLPGRFAMSPQESRRQVLLANAYLGEAGPQVGRALTDANYSLYFTGKTMATGTRLGELTIADVIESDIQDEMPHLSRTNLAIGGLVGSFAQNRGDSDLHIIDLGSGSGATLQAIARGLVETADTDATGRVSLTSIESNSDFCNQLGQLSSELMTALRPFELSLGKIAVPKLTRLHPEALQLVHQDIVEASKSLGSQASAQSEGITVVTANFVLHRLPSRAKSEIIRNISASSENTIFTIGDLIQNGSYVNRHYFNLGNNGPLNAGNTDLVRLLADEGFAVKQVGREPAPKSIHPKLVERITAEPHNDGYMWIAYKGKKARQLVQAA